MTLREKTLTHQLAECQTALVQSRRENELLRQKIDLLVRRVFGASSEQLDRSQLELLLQLSSTPTEPTVVNPPKKELKEQPRKVRAPRLPEHLPVVEEVIEPEPVKTAPEQWRCIGQEVSEQLDYDLAFDIGRLCVNSCAQPMRAHQWMQPLYEFEIGDGEAY